MLSALILVLVIWMMLPHLRGMYNHRHHEMEPRTRIVNGIPTTTDQWPWIVSLRFEINDYDEHFCGGSIIRRTRPAAILTAAHCVEWLDAAPYNVTWGKSWNVWIDIGRDDVSLNDTEYLNHDNSLYDSYKMSSFVYHENITYDSYYENTAIEDVAIIFIDQELPKTQPIITLNSEMINSLSDGDDLIVIGYGLNEWQGELTETLEQTDLKFINDTACNIGVDRFFEENWPIENYTDFLAAIGIQYGNMDQYPYNIIQCQECVLCTVGVEGDACNGDSGSPVIIGSNIENAIQVGIVSFGFECNVPGVPAQHTDVAYYYQWIQNALNGDMDTEDDDDDAAYSVNNNNALVILSCLCLTVCVLH